MNEGPMSLFSEVSSEGSEETESTRPLKSADEINEWFVEGLEGVKLKDTGFNYFLPTLGGGGIWDKLFKRSPVLYFFEQKSRQSETNTYVVDMQ